MKIENIRKAGKIADTIEVLDDIINNIKASEEVPSYDINKLFRSISVEQRGSIVDCLNGIKEEYEDEAEKL